MKVTELAADVITPILYYVMVAMEGCYSSLLTNTSQCKWCSDTKNGHELSILESNLAGVGLNMSYIDRAGPCIEDVSKRLYPQIVTG